MNSIFEIKKNSLRTGNIKTVKYGIETLSYRGPKTWTLVPDDIKNSKTLIEFKSKIKDWKPVGCDCKLCKTFIPSLGLL